MWERVRSTNEESRKKEREKRKREGECEEWECGVRRGERESV